jgi:hypothetical protein
MRSSWLDQYYGALHSSRLCPLLARINVYLVRWIRKKYKRLRPYTKAMVGLATHHPPVPQTVLPLGMGPLRLADTMTRAG